MHQHKYKNIFLKEVERVFGERTDIDPQALEYLRWTFKMGHLDPKTLEFCLRQRMERDR